MAGLLDSLVEFARERPIVCAAIGLGCYTIVGDRAWSRRAEPRTSNVLSARVRWGAHASADIEPPPQQEPPRRAPRASRRPITYALDGHVLQVEIKLNRRDVVASGWNGSSVHDLSVNFYGSGLPSIAGFFLPLKSNSKYLKIVASREDDTCTRLKIGLGASFEQEKVLKQLKNFVSEDRAIFLEVIHTSYSSPKVNPESICAVCISPRGLYSWLEASTEQEPSEPGPSSMILSTTSPKFADGVRLRPRERTPIGVLARFIVCPLTSASIACSALFAGPRAALLQALPAFPTFGFLSGMQSISSALPAMPKSMLEAYDLGVLRETLRHVRPGSSEYVAAMDGIVKLLGRVVTETELDAIRLELVKAMSHRSLGQRVMGFFSFVNLMWLAAIFGITISVGPVLWLLTKPLRSLIMQILGKVATFVKETVVWITKNVLAPALVRCHKLGVFEFVGHLVALTLYVQGLRLSDYDMGTYVSISGVIACVAACGYSSVLHKPSGAVGELQQSYPKVPIKHLAVKVLHPLCPAAFCVPAAIVHQSTLLGFASVASILAALGFGVAAFPFCYCVGWNSEDDMARSCAACGLGMIAFVAIRVRGIDSMYLKPFASGVSVLGGVGHYLALLIMSNAYSRGKQRDRYVLHNGSMVVSLVASLLAGNYLGMSGLSNTATTFFVLWGIDKARELSMLCKLSAWFLVFGGSLAAYYAALWLHAHPAFVVSIFKGLE
eukprot:TRINITY_DN30733_c0_g1_i1.p1 TRINITY_DN30733_c0_g1~~TRINITY_DN30733_c0_g1_i1.p1  ORF type:complete len:723 (+),score=72.05 TRINITY_DN30733_c0_g1_i1:60-2228(+)